MAVQAAGMQCKSKFGAILAVRIIGLGLLAVVCALKRGERFISSDDATIDATQPPRSRRRGGSRR
jgi:hypothetical protein